MHYSDEGVSVDKAPYLSIAMKEDVLTLVLDLSQEAIGICEGNEFVS